MDTVSWLCPSLPTETLKWLSSLPILMQESFWWWQCSDRFILSLFPKLHTPFPPFSPSLINLMMVSVDVKHHVYLLTYPGAECRNHSGGDSVAIGITPLFPPPPPPPTPPFSPSLISRMVSVDVKHHVYLLTNKASCDETETCDLNEALCC